MATEKEILVEQAQLLDIETDGLTVPKLKEAIASKKEETTKGTKEDDKELTDSKEDGEDVVESDCVSIYAQNKLSMIRYIGEKPREFKESLKRPFPILNTGDICVVDTKTANFLTRPTGGFEKIDLKEITIK
jgi:hypothetical protein